MAAPNEPPRVMARVTGRERESGMGTFGQFETRPGDPGKRFPGGTVTYDARRPGETEFRYLVKLVRRRSMTVDPQTGEIAPDRRVEEQRELFATQREMTRSRPAPANKGDRSGGPADRSDVAPRYWAAVHDLGTTPDGAFAVLDHFDATLQKLIEVRQEPFASAELKHLVGSILNGLQELRSFGSRAHGKIKPSNVLLGRGRRGGAGKRLTGVPVVLSDLGPGREATEAGDVGALGEILYLCVTREPFNPSDVAVDDSPEWQRLGPAGRAWRELCARCVHPVPAQRPTLADAESLLNAIKLPKSRRWRKALAAAVLAALLAMGVGFKLWHNGNRALYRQYSGAYFGWARDTVDTLRTSIDPTAYGVGPAERLRAKFTRQYQKQPARPSDTGLRTNDRASDDPFWRGLLDRWERKPALHSPEEVRSVDPRSAPKLREWLAGVESLRAEIAQWPALAQLAKAEAAFDRAGWAGPRDVCRESRARVLHPLGAAPADLPPPTKKLDLPDAVMSVAEVERVAGNLLDGLVRQLDTLDSLDAEIAAKSADPKLKGLAAQVKKDLAAAAAVTVTDLDTRAAARFDLEQVREDEARNLALRRSLDKLDEDLGRATQQVDAVAALVRDGKWFGQGAPAVANADALSTELRLRALIAHNDDLLKNDPRAASKLPDRLAVLRRQLDGRDAGARVDWLEKNGYAAAGPTAANVRQARAAVTSAAGALAAMERKLAAVQALPFPKEALRIGTGLAELAAAADRYEASELPNVTAAVAKSAAAVQSYEQEKAKDDPAIDAGQADRFAGGEAEGVAGTWAAWLPSLRSAADGRKLSGKPRRDHYDAAADVLTRFAAEPAPAGPPAAANWAVASFQDRFVADAAKAWPALKAEALARRGKAAPLGADKQTVDPAALGSAIKEAKDAYGRRLTGVVAVAQAAGVLKERLARCERFTAPWPPAGTGDGGGGTPAGGTLRQSAAALQSALSAARSSVGSASAVTAGPALADDAELKALQQSATRAEPVEDADSRLLANPPAFTADDRKAVAAALKRPDAPLELRYNAWLVLRDVAAKRLAPSAGVDVWPATADELADEQAARQALAKELFTRALPSPDAEAWRSVRLGELRQAGPVALRRYVERAAHRQPPAAVAQVVGTVNQKVLTNFDTDEVGFRAALSGPVKVALAISGARASTPESGGTGARKLAAALADELDDAAKWQPSAADPYDFWSGRDAEAAKLRSAYAGMAKQLRDKLDNKPAAAVPADPPAVAPPDFASAGLGALGWTPKAGPGDTVTYTYSYAAPAAATAVGRKPVTMTFAPVPGATPATGQPTPYLATTELSVEMANAIMASASAKARPGDGWKQWMSLAMIQEGGLDTVESGDEDRKGPRAWRWDRTAGADKQGELRPTKGWMMDRAPVNYYPRVGGSRFLLPAREPGGDPDISHPLQRLSPAQAVYLAAVANGRLPSVAEWKLAYKAETGTGTAPLWNLRDSAFAAEQDYLKALLAKSQVGVYYPDTGIFWPRGGDPTPLSGPNAEAGRSVPTDGVIWFCPVDKGWSAARVAGPAPGAVFKHLVGNVAEFVATAQPAQPRDINLDPRAAGRWAAEDVGGAARVSVIGLSALSPPRYTLPGGRTVDVAPDVPFDADGRLDARGQEGTVQSKVAYTDVGIRLAIDVAGGGGGAVAVQQQPESLGEWFKKWADAANPWPS